MRFTSYDDPIDQWSKYVLFIDRRSCALAELDSVDKAFLRECDKSHKISDKLLALELIVRRIEEKEVSLTQ